jgi:hypothetical protein
MTFMMRPSVALPTGIAMGLLVFTTDMPRWRPSVVSMAMAPHGVLAEVLRHLDHEVVLPASSMAGLVTRSAVKISGRSTAVEPHVDHRSQDLRDVSSLLAHMTPLGSGHFMASAPPMISMSSFVMAAWRARFISSVRL